MRGSTVKIISNTNDAIVINSNSDESKSYIGKELLYNISVIYDISSRDCLKSKNSLNSYQNHALNSRNEITNLNNQLTQMVTQKEDLILLITKLSNLVNTNPNIDTIDVHIGSILNKTYEFNFGLQFFFLNYFSLNLENVLLNWNPEIEDVPIFKWWIHIQSGVEQNPILNELNELMLYKSEKICKFKVVKFCSCVWNVYQPQKLIAMIINLATIFKKSTINEILYETIYPKLDLTLQAWSPVKNEPSIDSWIIPWVSLLGNRIVDLFPLVRLKLSKDIKRHNLFDKYAYDIIRPWYGIFDNLSMLNLISKTVAPLLSQYLLQKEYQDFDYYPRLLDSLLLWIDILPKSFFYKNFLQEYLKNVTAYIIYLMNRDQVHQASKLYMTLRSKIFYTLLKDKNTFENIKKLLELLVVVSRK
jgi:hypothetical protein